MIGALGGALGVGSILGGAGSLFTALDGAFGSGKKNIKIAQDNLNLAKKQLETENKRYDENKATNQSNLDMIGSVFSEDSVFNRI